MKQNIFRRFFVFSIILAVLISGCGATVSIKPNAAATVASTAKVAPAANTESTVIVVPTATSAQTTTPAETAAPTLTATPAQTAAPTPSLPKMVVYTDPANSFSISVPGDWNATKINGYAYLSSPDGTVSAELAAVNTNYALNAEVFTNMINTVEFNLFSYRKNYKEVGREVQADKGSAYVSKTLDVNKIPYKATTVYYQENKVLFIQTFFSTESAAVTSAPILNFMVSSFKPNPAYAVDLPPFTSYMQYYADPNKLFQLIVPVLWTYTDTSKDGSVRQFSSPDNAAAISLVKRDLGKTVTRTIADKYSLDFLKSITNEDLRISKMKVLKNENKNDSIQMTWESKKSKMAGTSIYGWKGKQWFFLTWIADAGFENVYTPVFDKSIANYSIPE